MTNEDIPVRRRQLSAEAVTARQAASLMRPLNARLGAWHATAIKLRTMAERERGSGRLDARAASEAAALLEVVEREAELLDSSLPDQPLAVTANTRIQDTRRSLEAIGKRLRETLVMLGAEDVSKHSG